VQPVHHPRSSQHDDWADVVVRTVGPPDLTVRHRAIDVDAPRRAPRHRRERTPHSRRAAGPEPANRRAIPDSPSLRSSLAWHEPWYAECHVAGTPDRLGSRAPTWQACSFGAFGGIRTSNLRICSPLRSGIRCDRAQSPSDRLSDRDRRRCGKGDRPRVTDGDRCCPLRTKPTFSLVFYTYTYDIVESLGFNRPNARSLTFGSGSVSATLVSRRRCSVVQSSAPQASRA
jgi:hypothetical protein